MNLSDFPGQNPNVTRIPNASQVPNWRYAANGSSTITPQPSPVPPNQQVVPYSGAAQGAADAGSAGSAAQGASAAAQGFAARARSLGSSLLDPYALGKTAGNFVRNNLGTGLAAAAAGAGAAMDDSGEGVFKSDSAPWWLKGAVAARQVGKWGLPGAGMAAGGAAGSGLASVPLAAVGGYLGNKAFNALGDAADWTANKLGINTLNQELAARNFDASGNVRVPQASYSNEGRGLAQLPAPAQPGGAQPYSPTGVPGATTPPPAGAPGTDPSAQNQIKKTVDAKGNVTYSGSDGAGFTPSGKPGVETGKVGGYVFGNAPGTGPGTPGGQGYNPYDPYGVQALRAQKLPGLLNQYQSVLDMAHDGKTSPLVISNMLSGLRDQMSGLAQMPVGMNGVMTPQQAAELQMRGMEFGQHQKEANVKQNSDYIAGQFLKPDGTPDPAAAGNFERILGTLPQAGANPKEMAPAAVSQLAGLMRIYNKAAANQAGWAGSRVPELTNAQQLLGMRLSPDGSQLNFYDQNGHVLNSFNAEALRKQDPGLLETYLNIGTPWGARDASVDALIPKEGR